MIEHEFMERMRQQIVAGYIQAGAPRDYAHEIADLTLYAFQQADEALERVADSASNLAVYAAVLTNATQVAAALFTDKSEAFAQAASDFGLTVGSLNLGGVPQ